MQRRKKPDRAPVVSVTGAMYGCAAAFFLISGLARGELVSSICGGLLLCYALFCLTFALASYASTRSATGRFSWVDANSVSAAITTRRERIPFGRFPFADATLVARYRIEPETPFTDPYTLSIPLRDGETIATITLPPRGFYVPIGVSLVISDFSGFFAFSRDLPESSCAPAFTVYPKPEPPREGRVSASAEGDASGKSVFRRSEDLYESRPYFPGDDPRKINWGLYAHTGALFLREGELLPPPADEYVIAFVTRIAQDASRAESKREFDALVDRAASCAIELSRQRKSVTIPIAMAQGTWDPIRVVNGEPNAEERILSALAHVQPGHPQFADVDAKRQRGHAPTTLLFLTGNADPSLFSTLAPSARLCLFVGPWTAEAETGGNLAALCDSLANGGFNVSKA